MTARTAGKAWTREEILALPARIDGVTACGIVYGYSRTKAYQALAAGDVDFPVIARHGPGGNWTRYTVPTQAVLELLHLDRMSPEAS